ncbi:restriction endonuclease [Paenibacillus azoreducens]|uniref:Restriction endonuclease type IV Mrr domain-containing protein n=1 Tax=Paenibacillus azoreducens TaxID=116718 RepID=A0A919YBD3_9BACL|nr:restriction endonuclease [Paenibacillus azoreducens]GIO45890.1 hypothetical protein J34TS1_06550 [Paenibacillus azoreducens]
MNYQENALEAFSSHEDMKETLYVITTSDFTSNAYTYAQGLNIDLINGKQVVDLWLDFLDAKRDQIDGLQAASQM